MTRAASDDGYRYDEVRVVFGPGQAAEVHRVLAFDRATGAHAEGSFTTPRLDDMIREVAPLVSCETRLDAATRSSSTRDVGTTAPARRKAEEIGGRLAAALLHGDVGSLYQSARDRAEREPGRGVRLAISLGRSPGLLDLPWEFLFVRPQFLASQRRTPVVRVVESAPSAVAPVIDGELKILGVVASPQDLGPLDVIAERARVERAIAPLREQGRVHIDWVQPATPSGLRAALRDETYHIVHFVGHSDFSSTGEGIILLEDPSGFALAVDRTLLANLLADQLGNLRLVVLNSCRGARTSAADPHAGVAATLMSLGLPAVVGMQFEISDDAAIVFADEFYANLVGRRAPIDIAIAEARKAIYTEVSDIEWATPVLFMRDPTVALFEFASTDHQPWRESSMQQVDPSDVVQALVELAQAAGQQGQQDVRRHAMWRTLSERFERDPASAHALERLLDKPGDRRRVGAVEGHLEDLLDADPTFAVVVGRLLDDIAPSDHGHAIIFDAGATAIGGSVTITAGGHAAGRDLVVGGDHDAARPGRWGRRGRRDRG